MFMLELYCTQPGTQFYFIVQPQQMIFEIISYHALILKK
jgi:hypothetical protein